MTSINTEKSRYSKYPSPITLRLSQNEIDRLDGMVSGSSRSAYIRKQIFGKKTDKRKYRPKTPKTDDVAISQILAMLGASRIGNNLNQLAKAANSGALMADDEVIAQIEEAYAFHLAIRSMLTEALGLKTDSDDKHPSDQ